MEKHTLFGADLLSGGPSELLKIAEKVALTHHEWWDGKGYPNGLTGTAIPLEGRICSIADVFDTITSIRIYKEPQTIEEAEQEIRKGSGAEFDPRLVSVFLELIPEIKALHIPETYPHSGTAHNTKVKQVASAVPVTDQIRMYYI